MARRWRRHTAGGAADNRVAPAQVLLALFVLWYLVGTIAAHAEWVLAVTLVIALVLWALALVAGYLGIPVATHLSFVAGRWRLRRELRRVERGGSSPRLFE